MWSAASLSMVGAAGLFSLDLKVSQFFFTPGMGFTYAKHPLVLASYRWTPVVGRAVLVALLLGVLLKPLMASFYRRGCASWASPERLARLDRMAVIALTCAVLGPGLVHRRGV